jgi:hypothetical protein
MFGTLTKALYGTVAAALAAVVALAFIGGNRSGVALLVFGSVAAFALGTVLVLGGIREAVVLDADSIAEIPATGRGVTAASAWPMLAAAAGLSVVLGFVYGLAFSMIGLVLILLAFCGWLAMNLREDAAWTGEISARARDRFTAPFAIPLTAAVVVVLVGIAVSRVLLATSKNGSLIAAGVFSVLFLAGATIAAMTGRASRRLPVALLVVAFIGLGIAGVVGWSQGERKLVDEGALGKPPVIKVRASVEGNIFDTNRIVVPKVDSFTPRPSDEVLAAGHNGAPFSLKIANPNPKSHHNISFYTANPDVGGVAVFQGGWVAPGKTDTYQINATRFVGSNAGYLDANPDDTPRTYFWRCDLHPNMQGFVEVPSVNDVAETHGAKPHGDKSSDKDKSEGGH